MTKHSKLITPLPKFIVFMNSYVSSCIRLHASNSLHSLICFFLPLSRPRPVTEPDFWSAHSIGREVTVGDIEDEEDDQFKRLRLLVDVAVQQRDT